MSEELEILKIVTGRLDAEGIPYMVTGSMAVNYHGVPRMTRDIDVDRRTSFNAIHQRLVVKVDFVVRKDTEYRRTEFARRRRVSWEGHPFLIVAPEDLIISKLEWAKDTRSEVQLGDVRNLLRSAPEIDRSYLEQWTTRLGLGPLYREVSG